MALHLLLPTTQPRGGRRGWGCGNCGKLVVLLLLLLRSATALAQQERPAIRIKSERRVLENMAKLTAAALPRATCPPCFAAARRDAPPRLRHPERLCFVHCPKCGTSFLNTLMHGYAQGRTWCTAHTPRTSHSVHC